MINYIPKHGDMEMWLIVVAIGEDAALIDKMKKNKDGSYPVKFEVGGVELDFSKVSERIQKEVDRITCDNNTKIQEEAYRLLIERYNSLIEEIEDIKDRIENQKNALLNN